jgi:hypothetical protein
MVSSITKPIRRGMMSDYAGIDYGHGVSNVDKETGIRFGVISQHEVLQAWADSSDGYYGEPSCPKCGNETLVAYNGQKYTEKYEFAKYESADLICKSCRFVFGNDSAYLEEALSYSYEGEGYLAECGDDGDIFITKSPYYTYAQFCSPCAPGAGYLMSYFTPIDEEMRSYEEAAESAGFPKVYCFGDDWFEGGKAPYPVFEVESKRRVRCGERS